MSIELHPFGVKCNIACTYCYQEPMRAAGNEDPHCGDYKLEAMFEAALKEGVGQKDSSGRPTGFALFGGEPLLLPLKDLEAVFAWGRRQGINPGIQTNASLVTDHHIELFKQYGVNIGVSLDGPGLLNRAREAKDPGATDATTMKSQIALERMLKAGVCRSLIITLHRLNASTNARLATLVEWIDNMKALGLTHVNLHTLEDDNEAARDLILSEEQHIHAMRFLRGALKGLHVSPFTDMTNVLKGEDERDVNCVWHACDPYTTPAVRGVDGQGQSTNCGRTNKDGVAYEKAAQASKVRQLALYLTPQEHGGCQGCRFFYACKGCCPGEGEGRDWRSRTVHCGMLKAIFSDIERELFRAGTIPPSASVERARVEANLLAAWQQGRTMSVASALRQHSVGGVIEHSDTPHLDTPHLDHQDAERPVVSHGDHSDETAVPAR